MRSIPNFQVAMILAIVAAVMSFAWSGAGAQGEPIPIKTAENAETAIFAGGCFWCVESDFDKIDGVLETVSGYTGGETDNPTYRTHAAGKHLEVVQITFDPDLVGYQDLVSYFFRHIDPVDAGGQFCDRGHSYTTAIFALDEEQAAIANAEIDAIEASGVLPAPVVTDVRDAVAFYPAEDYHQDYYLKQPLKYSFYRRACGRDARVEELWGADVSG